VAKREAYIESTTAKVSEGTNRKLPAKNTLVPCASTLRATMHSVAGRQTADMMMPIADHTV